MTLTKKQASDIQETRVAEALNWSKVTGSGSRHLYPGDVISEFWIGECKTHVQPGHKIKFDIKVWEKLKNEAKSRFKFPALFVDDGSQNLDKTWVMFASTMDITDIAHIFDCRCPVRSNMVFDGDYLYNHIRKNIDDGKSIVYQAMFNDSLVYVCTFRYFNMMFGED